MENNITSLTKEQFKSNFAGYRPVNQVFPPKKDGNKHYLLFINGDDKLPVSLAKGVDPNQSVTSILANAQFGCFPTDDTVVYFITDSNLLEEDW